MTACHLIHFTRQNRAGVVRRTFLLALGVACALPLPAAACENWVARVVAAEGRVQHQSGQQDWQAVQPEELVCPGDSVRAGDNSRAALYLRNNTFARLDANSLLRFPAQESGTRFWIELQQGLAHFISRIVQTFEVSTPYVNAVVEGTEFIVSAHEQGTVSVLEGQVTAHNDQDRKTLTVGQQAVSTGRNQTLSQLNVKPASSVEWAIHYPPVLTLAELPATAEDSTSLQQAISALQQNRIDQAIAALDGGSPDGIRALARASLLLQAGRLQAFESSLQPVLQGPHAGLAQGLKAIAAVARNELAAGRIHAEAAVQQAPDRAASWLALSWVQQAELQPDATLESARKAVQVQPDSLLAHLRLSELHLVQGDVAAARVALESLPPQTADSAELEGSRGFIRLFRLQPRAAQAHFRRALALDSANPRYHLGLGLALIRQGDLEAGRQQLEYAVSLDPLRSSLRSWVGRAYFEEKRDQEAGKQWVLAQQFDPQDPTPHFYTGVARLLANDPLGAIDELDKSRELNDKRRIYRAGTGLQADAASRSATLARAYHAAGYPQGVLLNGWDALRQDPTSAEGHRLLADHYAGDSRYESARVSELLQAQIWQPLNAFPLQPQLGEANISLVENSGPQRPGPNEYHALFTRDGGYGMLNATGGSDSTWGNDLVGTVLAGPLALSLGQYHYESAGWRDDADQQQDAYSGFVQWQVAPSTRLQLEARRFDWDKGDLTPRWNDKQTRYLHDNQERETRRVSLIHDFNPRHGLALSWSRQQLDNDQAQQVAGQDVSRITLAQEPETWELQGVYRQPGLNLLYGGSRTRIDVDSSLTGGFGFDTLFELVPGVLYEPAHVTLDISGQDALKQRQDDLWAYAYWNPRPSTTVQLGLSRTWLELEGLSASNTRTRLEVPSLGITDISDAPSGNPVDQRDERWSPKLGLTYDLTRNLRLRAALFKAVSKTVAANQTLEPVTVAGFNQLYGDRDGLHSRNGGLGIDYGLDGGMNLGASVVRRLLEGEVLRFGAASADTRGDELLGDAWLHLPLGSRLAFYTGYRYARLDDAWVSGAIDAIPSARNESVPLGLHWFAGDRLTAKVQTTWYRHRLAIDEPPQAHRWDQQHAYVLDFSLRWALEQRLGAVEAGVMNATDEDTEIAQYQEGGIASLGFYPARMLFLRFNLNL